MRILRFLFGVLLIPVCVAATGVVLDLVRAAHPASAAAVPAPVWALGGGFLLWIVFYFTLPRPVRTYVLAHELTHALWGWLMGARVTKMKVSKQKGYVVLSKSNLLITLAPYFFPLYTVLVVAGYYVASLFWEVERYHLVWLALVGLTWGFHFTFTISTLLQHQTDIQAYGHVFSYAVIYLLNVLGIGLWVVMVSSATLEQMLRSSRRNAVAVARGLEQGARQIRAHLQ
jgi:hypothetical protein